VAGGRDGFKAEEFHRRCDGRANTLTAILDTEGNFFGGFAPVKWERNSLKSFLFTLKNLHNAPARRFALKAEKKDRAFPDWAQTLVTFVCPMTARPALTI
jgi:hypothetical protein